MPTPKLSGGTGHQIRRSPLLQRPLFHPLPLLHHCFCVPEIQICWREIVQRLVVTPLVVVLDERANGVFQLPREIMVFKAADVLQRAMVMLNLALGYGVVRFPSSMLQLVLVEKGRQLMRHVRRPIVREQARTMLGRDLRTSRPQISVVSYQFRNNALLLFFARNSDHLFNLEHQLEVTLFTPT